MDDFTEDIEFPFRSVLNLRLLVEYWEEKIRQRAMPSFVLGVQEYIDSAPELKQPVTDRAVLEKHSTFIDFLMTAVAPSANSETELVAAIEPFHFKSIFSTRGFSKNIDLVQLENVAAANVPGNRLSTGKTIKASLLILEKFYGLDYQYDKPVLITIPHKDGVDKVYKVEINHQFCEIIARNPVQPIEKSVLKFLTEKIYDTDLVLQYLRPEDFEFHGFMVFRLVDVTEQEMLSAIKYDLLERDAVTLKSNSQKIQRKLRSIFRIPNLKLGLAYFDPNDNLIVNSGLDSWDSYYSQASEKCNVYQGSVYERAWLEKRYITIENLEEYPLRSAVEDTLIKLGVKSLLLAPLIDNNETIGLIELASSEVGKLNSLSAHKVEGALPMFTAAVKRAREEMSTQVRAIIQEECTAIHPTVQWRFFEAGLELLNKRRNEVKDAVMEEIVFKEVYPLFGLADIRNSSTERNTAIQKDLQENLKLTQDLLTGIHLSKKLPLLEEVIFRTNEQLQKINRGLASGDESNVLEFLKSEINPLVEHFSKDKSLSQLIETYKSNLDPVFGVVYQRRRAFEESLAMINETISAFLDNSEEEAQRMFPHYFEKYKTDGVEYTLYLGSSLVKNKTFDSFYLKNFRLWQLLVMVEISRKIDAIKPKMKSPLDITQLILVHDQPISIRFRQDEKRFDVDGAYDMRYEIVKKRIDKAHIKGTNERLTQPGKIAIVYNQAKMEDEYKRYFQYLKTRNLITGGIEELELEELPGANGLRALRIQINTGNKLQDILTQDDLLKDIEEGLRVH